MTQALRRTPSGAFDVVRIDLARANAEPEWDSLVSAGQAPLRHAFTLAWQQVDLPNLHCFPLIVREDGRAAAAAHAYTYDLDIAGAHSRFATVGMALTRRVWPRALISRVFEIGSPTPIVNPFLAAPTATAGAFEVLVDAALECAHESRADMTIVQNFEAANLRSAITRTLTDRGFDAVPIPPTVILPLPYASFDDYLDAMRAQYRRRAKKVFEKSAHLEVEYLKTFADAAPTLAAMWRLVYERAPDLKREVINESFFRAVSDVEQARILALRRPDGSLASFALLVEDAPWLHFLYTGFDRDAGEQEGAYFRLLYELARYAIDGGFATVNLGMTTLAPKLDVGGVPLPLNAWIRHRRRRLQPFYTRLARGPLAPEIVPARNVFKR
jgi:hypothetical protein